jgi:hypothetical protein
MTRTIIKAIRDALLANAGLVAALGGDYVYMAEIMQTNQIPAVTLRLTSEGSKKRVGYNSIKKRDNSPLIQIDVWSKKSRLETYNIADIIDEIVVSDSITDTRSWIKIGDGDMYEPDTKIYHKPLRYSFDYTITDAAYFQLGYGMLGYDALG